MRKPADLWRAVVLVALSVPAPSFASDPPEQYDIIPSVGLKAICYEAPRGNNWDSIASSKRYELLAFESQNLDPTDDYVDDPVAYRLVVENFPCYYSYKSSKFRGMGTRVDTTRPFPPPTLVDGFEYPSVFEPGTLEPLISKLVSECRASLGLEYPWRSPIGISCENQVADALVRETTSLTISISEEDEVSEIKVNFVFGYPYFEGRIIEPW